MSPYIVPGAHAFAAVARPRYVLGVLVAARVSPELIAPSIVIPPALVTVETTKLFVGLVVPIPTLPLALTTKRVEVAPLLVDEPIAKSVVRTEVDAAFTDRSANGEVEATPTLPALLAFNTRVLAEISRGLYVEVSRS